MNNVSIIIVSASVIASSFLIFILKKRIKRKKITLNEINQEEISKWKKDRRNNQTPVSLNVQAMGNNIEKSHDLWKSLSKMVHESKWIGENQEKIKLAAELNSLINEHKGNYLELQKINTRIEDDLLNENKLNNL